MKVRPAPTFRPVPTRGCRRSHDDSRNAKQPSTVKISAVSTAKIAPYTSICSATGPRAALTNCGRKASTNSPGFGFSTFDSSPVRNTLRSGWWAPGSNDTRLRDDSAL